MIWQMIEMKLRTGIEIKAMLIGGGGHGTSEKGNQKR
jgi:hypothetical protein